MTVWKDGQRPYEAVLCTYEDEDGNGNGNGNGNEDENEDGNGNGNEDENGNGNGNGNGNENEAPTKISAFSAISARHLQIEYYRGRDAHVPGVDELSIKH